MVVSRLIVITLLVTASLGQLNRLFIGDGEGVVLYINDILVGLLSVLYLGHALIVRRSWVIPPVMTILWLFLAIGTFGLVLGWSWLGISELIVSLSYWVRYLCYSFLFFVVFDSIIYTKNSLNREKEIRQWTIWVLIAALLMAVSGFIQLYLLPDLAILARYGWDPHVGRLTTAMLDPNYAGTYLSIMVAIAVSLFLYIDKPRWRWSLAILIALLTLAVLLTYSRSGYITLAITLGIIALIKSRWLLVVGLVMAVLAYATVPRIQDRIQGALEVDASASPRIVSWQNSIQIASQNQPFGIGFNTYRYAQDRYGILDLEESGNAGAGGDSSWLFVFATTGLVGLITFVSMYLSFMWFSWRGLTFSTTPFEKAICLSSLAILVGLGVASQFNNALFYPWIVEIFWVILALVMSINQFIVKPVENLDA